MNTAYKLILLLLFILFLLNNAKADRPVTVNGILSDAGDSTGQHHSYIVHENNMFK